MPDVHQLLGLVVEEGGARVATLGLPGGRRAQLLVSDQQLGAEEILRCAPLLAALAPPASPGHLQVG